MKVCENTRHDNLLNPFDKGLHFLTKKGAYADLSSLLVCNIAVDTVRQLYKGTIENRLIELFRMLSMEDSPILDRDMLSGSQSKIFNGLQLPCRHLKLSRMGKASGFRYKLQNNEIGIVILLGSYFSSLDKEWSHLKIELSPHFIAKRTPVQVQSYLDEVAKCFMSSPTPSGVAPHICVDLQGWEMPYSLSEHITTRSKFIRDYKGVGSVASSALTDLISTFNRSETLMVGRASGLQLSIYRKDLEIVKRDNVDYYHDIWGRFTQGEHNPSKPVTRVEMRFHHTIVEQFSYSAKTELNSYLAVSDHLNSLWKYALNTIRLSHFEEKDTIHPLWQLLRDDIQFNDADDIRQDTFKRVSTRKTDTSSVVRNMAMMVGNLLSIHARTGRSFRLIAKDIKNSPALIDPLRDYFAQHGIDESIYFQDLERRLLERRVASKYGVAA